MDSDIVTVSGIPISTTVLVTKVSKERQVEMIESSHLPFPSFGSVRRRQTLSIWQPLILVGVVRHIQVWEKALGPQVGVYWKKGLAHECWGFQIREEVLEEVRRVDVAGIGIGIDLLGALVDGAVIVDNNLVHRENGQDSGNTARICGPLLSGHAATHDISS
jgi:hypothetical protein